MASAKSSTRYNGKENKLKITHRLLLCNGLDPVGTLRFWDTRSLASPPADGVSLVLSRGRNTCRDVEDGVENVVVRMAPTLKEAKRARRTSSRREQSCC